MKKISVEIAFSVQVTPRYGYWRELLEQWVFLVERSYRVTNTKHPVYAYKERTNVGLLAAAAAANGWVALEECRATKSKPSSKPSESEELYEGRSDMRLWREKRHHDVEAKFLRVPLLTSSKKRFDRLDTVVLGAKAASSRSIATDDRVDRKIALIYVVPTASRLQHEGLEKEKNSIMKNTNIILEHIRKQHPHFLAYAFPGATHAVGTKERSAYGAILFGYEQGDI